MIHIDVGPVILYAPEDGTGYRAACCQCSWTDGNDRTGDYVWRVKERALKHIAAAHERRSGEDRRGR